MSNKLKELLAPVLTDAGQSQVVFIITPTASVFFNAGSKVSERAQLETAALAKQLLEASPVASTIDNLTFTVNLVDGQVTQVVVAGGKAKTKESKPQGCMLSKHAPLA